MRLVTACVAAIMVMGVMLPAAPVFAERAPSPSPRPAAPHKTAKVSSTSAVGVKALDEPISGIPCRGVSVGPAMTVVSDARRDALGLAGWPDSAMGVWRDGDGQYRFIGPGFGSGGNPLQDVMVTRGSLDDPVAGGVVVRGAVLGAPSGYTWDGGGPIYRDAKTGIMLQVLHLEQQYATDRFYATLHLGRVDPASGRVRYLGPLVSPEVPFPIASRLDWTVDVGTSSLTVIGDQIHVYFPDTSVAASGNYLITTSLSAARAPLSDVLAAAAAGGVVPWHKYRNGSWDSPALGGASTDLRPGHNPWGPHVVRNSSGAAVMVAGISAHEMVLSTSPDGVSDWSAEVPLFREPQHWLAYPTLVGTGSDPSIIGSQFYLYYTQFESADPDWGNVAVQRRLITCTAGRSPEKVPLVRYVDDHRHRVTTVRVSAPGVYSERGGIWFILDSQTAGTRPLYGCRNGNRDYFISPDPGCEGTSNAILQTEGWIYIDPPDAPSTALYRCYFPTSGDHMVSVNSDCESAKAVNEGRLGYAVSTSKVIYNSYSNGREHWETTGAVSGAYALERRWLLAGVSEPGTVALYSCSYNGPRGVEHMTSLRQDCENTTYLGIEGWIYRVSSGQSSDVPLYRCYAPAEYDHFLSATVTCDGVPGAIREGLLGYAARID